jgi:hypothetical protein
MPSSAPFDQQPAHDELEFRPRSVLVIASVDSLTPQLQGVDWIRIDGAAGTLEAINRPRQGHHHPVLFDVPGPRTRRRGSLLTTSEFLVFAAAEGFEWVNLRGVHHPVDVQRAREFLPSSVRLSVTVNSALVLQGEIEGLYQTADAILLDRETLKHGLGSRRADQLLSDTVRSATAHGTPTLLTSGVLPSMLQQPRPSAFDVGRLTELVEDGLCGLVLDREITETEDPQSCIDVARLVAEHGRSFGDRRQDTRPAARVSGQVSVVLDGAPGATTAQ